MKNIKILTVFIIALTFNSCGINDSEKIADEFHAKLDAGEYDYIVQNLIHEDAISDLGEETWYSIFYEIESRWGKATGREKDFGFETKTNNGITRVKLDYTCTYPNVTVYERMFIATSNSGSYKIFGLFLDEDKDALHRIAGELQ